MKSINRLHQMFPELVLQVILRLFPDQHPLSTHAFWLFNSGNFAGESCRGKLNRSILLLIDPDRGEAAIIPGYGLEPFLTPEALKHLLELASPEWSNERWAAGILRVLDGIKNLLELAAEPFDAEQKVAGEY
jgi:TPM domain